MRRLMLALLILALPAAAAAAEDPTYARANARQALAIPHYPAARLLVEESVAGEVGAVPFEAVLRVYRLSAPRSEHAVMRFYGRKLGAEWRPQGATCLVRGSKIVVAFVYPRQRRLGVVIDSRGAGRCYDLTGQVADLLAVGYPDP